jgi:C2 domain
MPASIKK